MSCNHCGEDFELCERDDAFVCEGCYGNCDCDGCDMQKGCTIFIIRNEIEVNIPLDNLAKTILNHINYSKGMQHQKLDAIKELCNTALGGSYD